MSDDQLIKDVTEHSTTRFVVFVVGGHLYELAFLHTEHYPDQTMVLDLNKNRFGLIDHETLDRPNYLEHVFQINEIDAEKLRARLHELI
ncbi:DUF3055 domain-containing protein [Halobacillus naozhouensis]|uniref:DUF3055 domain-containing protein n=1 Tax=Halobacillus naozhouensis TaxID=554880 RepID=A0ABY8IW89_9BACI|nr:DUF3055 domain-containing protein [Halobacillus naozhouensis]WFT73594.1 DUF3055 domain-containing protein [Halobacillus naozhouensis]